MPSVALLNQLRYQTTVNRYLLATRVRTRGPVLSPAELREMDEAFVSGVTAEQFAARIVARADGQPFAAEAQTWFHTTDGRYFANDSDRRAHQRTIDERCERYLRRCYAPACAEAESDGPAGRPGVVAFATPAA